MKKRKVKNRNETKKDSKWRGVQCSYRRVDGYRCVYDTICHHQHHQSPRYIVTNSSEEDVENSVGIRGGGERRVTVSVSTSSPSSTSSSSDEDEDSCITEKKYDLPESYTVLEHPFTMIISEAFAGAYRGDDKT